MPDHRPDSFTIDRDTQLCMSLAGRPGNFGTRFHNYLYRELGLNYVYKAFTTQDLPAAIGGVRALGVRGCAVSMPFKEAVILLVDELTPSAAAIQSVNTIVNDDGRLSAYNTDYIAVAKLIEKHAVPRDARLVLRGSGGMAKALAHALRDAGLENGCIVARNAAAGQALAGACGYAWASQMDDRPADLLVNVTPIGMAGGAEAQDMAFSPRHIDRAQIVFDVVALPPETPLVRYSRTAGKRVITGAEVIALQAVEQFVLYTGVRPDDALVARADQHARAS